MNIIVNIDLHGLDEKFREAAKRIERLPDSQGSNPCALALYDYQFEIGRTRRPTVAESGDFHGENWPQLAPAYTRKDGTVVPVYGGVPKARGRGKVKGRIKSEGVARGRGSRYQASDLQLGARAGGMWADFITQMPRLVASNFVAVLSSPFKYAARQFERRSWFGPSLQRFTEDRLAVRSEEYLSGVIEATGLK